MREIKPSEGALEHAPAAPDLTQAEAGEVIQRMHEVVGTRLDIELAERLDIGKSTPSNWRGRNRVSLEVCVGFAASYGLSLDWLLFGLGPKMRTHVRPDPDAIVMPAAHVGLSRLAGFDTTPGPDMLILPEVVVRRRIGAADTAALRWMVNPTDALAPRLAQGGLLLVDSSVDRQEDLVDGDTYVIRLWGRVNVRRIFGIGPNEFRLRGDREMEDRRDVTGPDYKHLEIGGRVIDVI